MRGDLISDVETGPGVASADHPGFILQGLTHIMSFLLETQPSKYLRTTSEPEIRQLTQHVLETPIQPIQNQQKASPQKFLLGKKMGCFVCQLYYRPLDAWQRTPHSFLSNPSPSKALGHICSFL